MLNKILLAAFIIWLVIVSIWINSLSKIRLQDMPVQEAVYVKRTNLDQLINDTAALHSIDSQLFHCVLHVESNKRLGAINTVTGDYGIGQINIRSWPKFSPARLTTDLQYSLNASAEILSFYKQLKQAEEPRQWACRYNVGPGPFSKRNRAANCERYLEKLSNCLKQ